MKYYYTFGPNHYLGTAPLQNEYVVVEISNCVNVDPRAIFMGWRGSNAFAFEYDEMSWKERVYPKYYQGRAPLVEIIVEIRE